MTAIKLRSYQQEAIDAVTAAYRRGIRRPCIALPTGTGKTVVFSSVTAGARRKNRRVLILAHRDELINQAVDKLLQVAPELVLEVGIVKAAKNDVHSPVVVASVQTLSRPNRMAELKAAGGFDIIIVDEAHHAAASTYTDVVSGLGGFEPGGPLVIGVTATPQRADAKDLGEVWQEIVYHRDILWAIRSGYLCDLRGLQVRLDHFDASELKTSHGEFQANQAGDLLSNADAPEHAVKAWQEHAAGRSTIVFTPTIALAHEFADTFADAGIPAEALSGNTPEAERRAILERLHTGETLVVANAQVLTEGFDEPRISCIVVARPTKSQGMYVQMVGRGTRPFPGKTDCLVIDLVGASDRLDLTTLPKLFGLGDQDDATKAADEVAPLAGLDVEMAAALLEEEGIGFLAQRVEDERVSTGRLVARQVELFTRADVSWVRTGDGAWCLSLDDRDVIIEADLAGDWLVKVYGKGKAPETIADGLEQGYAMGVAEDYAREYAPASIALIDKNAAWRLKPIAPKQRKALRRMGIVEPDGCTRGMASELITAAAARKRRSR